MKSVRSWTLPVFLTVSLAICVVLAENGEGDAIEKQTAEKIPQSSCKRRLAQNASQGGKGVCPNRTQVSTFVNLLKGYIRKHRVKLQEKGLTEEQQNIAKEKEKVSRGGSAGTESKIIPSNPHSYE